MNRYPNPKSHVDTERTRPILDWVREITADKYRPQLLRVTAYRGEKSIGDTLVSHEHAQAAITAYPTATHLTVEHLGDV